MYIIPKVEYSGAIIATSDFKALYFVGGENKVQIAVVLFGDEQIIPGNLILGKVITFS
jgi:hypothetical protein